jgi:hypothetical protein
MDAVSFLDTAPAASRTTVKATYKNGRDAIRKERI